MPVNGVPHDTIVAIVGAGAMGVGIAQVAATAGHLVYVFDISAEAIQAGDKRLQGALSVAVEKGKLSKPERLEVLSRVIFTHEIEDLKPAKLIIEAIAENLDAKRALFQRLDELADRETILATNTSSISISEIAAGSKHPERVVGMHFFNPAQAMKLVEVVSGLATSSAVASSVFKFAEQWRKKPVLVRSVPGFIVNRVARPFYAEAFRMLEEGVTSPVLIDHVLKCCAGFRMGPFELTDLIGHDVNAAVSASVFDRYHHEVRFLPSIIQEEYVAIGRLGRKSGIGVYNYTNGVPAPAEPEHKRPKRTLHIRASDKMGPAHDLLAEIANVGVSVEIDPAMAHGVLNCDDVEIALTDGRLATERSNHSGKSVVLYDLALNYKTSPVIALAPGDQASDGDIDIAVSLFQIIGKDVFIIDDYPGMIVMRIMVMLANVAADAVRDCVAIPSEIDNAMRYGANYPIGPLEWGDLVGVSRVFETLCNLTQTIGEPRYGPSQYIRRRACAGRPLQ